ncbi:septum formation initiator family protein [Candidatus Gracilibacteria bacterium]|jgi:cell division protein FtsB|nr:septum formation initiator family protein [Candidatus Gracilibacteria bacterium]
MSSRFSNTSSFTRIIIIVEFLLVSYLIYSLTKNVYNSYKIDTYIETFRAENERIAQENAQKNDDYLYFTSEEYIDKIAKQSLGLVNPGEEVIVLSEDVLSKNDEVLDGGTGEFAKDIGLSNAQKWWKFFFGN